MQYRIIEVNEIISMFVALKILYNLDFTPDSLCHHIVGKYIFNITLKVAKSSFAAYIQNYHG